MPVQDPLSRRTADLGISDARWARAGTWNQTRSLTSRTAVSATRNSGCHPNCGKSGRPWALFSLPGDDGTKTTAKECVWCCRGPPPGRLGAVCSTGSPGTRPLKDPATLPSGQLDPSHHAEPVSGLPPVLPRSYPQTWLVAPTSSQGDLALTCVAPLPRDHSAPPPPPPGPQAHQSWEGQSACLLFFWKRAHTLGTPAGLQARVAHPGHVGPLQEKAVVGSPAQTPYNV